MQQRIQRDAQAAHQAVRLHPLAAGMRAAARNQPERHGGDAAGQRDVGVRGACAQADGAVIEQITPSWRTKLRRIFVAGKERERRRSSATLSEQRHSQRQKDKPATAP
jgi:hypothetical protein